MNDLQIFNNDSFGQIRTVEINGITHFVASDIANALGYANARDAIGRHCRWVAKHDIPHPQSQNKFIEVNVIPKSDIYRLVASSELDAAEKFESWIFDEVLPAIEKHGAYITPQKIEEILLNPDTVIQLATILKEEQEKNRQLQLTTMQQKQIIGELQPKATYYDLILQNKSLLSVTKISKDYGLSAMALNQILHEEKIQFKQGDCWLLYQDYADKGYTQSKTQIIDEERSKLHTYWTQSGRLFLYDLLKRKRGLLPIIERKQTGKQVG